MKILPILSLAFTVSCAAFADEVKPLLHNHALPVLATPTFKEPLDAAWSVAKGKWTPHDGVLDVLDVPEEKHIPVLHHKAGLASATIEVEFLIDGAGTFLVGCDGPGHVGRVVVNGGSVSIAEDSVKPSHTIAKTDTVVKPGEWHHLRVESGRATAWRQISTARKCARSTSSSRRRRSRAGWRRGSRCMCAI